MIAILQPIIPHYREDFFKGIQKTIPCEIYVYEKQSSALNANFKLSVCYVESLRRISFKGFLLYSIRPFIARKYDTLVLMLHFAHISTWLLLLAKPFHEKKVIVWGHGISVKRYLKENKKPSFLLKMMLSMADEAWVYTEKEKQLWGKYLPNKPITALGNTFSGVEEVLTTGNQVRKKLLKENYNIKQPLCFIFCARFNSPYRRIDLLIKVVERLDSSRYGFIIIGDGKNKPDFSKYSNVYDFGSVYERRLKNDLFSIADIYFQPAWVGLSVVEAMAYGKPVFTFQRSLEILQCVEYGYIKNKENGLIFVNIEDFLSQLKKLSIEEINSMGNRARRYVQNNLRMRNMIDNAVNSLINLQ